MKFKTPDSLLNGHESLQEDLNTIIELGGIVGDKAKYVSKILAQHFKKEEEYALPPLGLLLELAEGHWELAPDAAFSISDKIYSQVKELKEEHEKISTELIELEKIAIENDNRKAQRFVKDLAIHVDIEDQVLYPAAILVSNYLDKLKSSK